MKRFIKKLTQIKKRKTAKKIFGLASVAWSFRIGSLNLNPDSDSTISVNSHQKTECVINNTKASSNAGALISTGSGAVFEVSNSNPTRLAESNKVILVKSSDSTPSSGRRGSGPTMGSPKPKPTRSGSKSVHVNPYRRPPALKGNPGNPGNPKDSSNVIEHSYVESNIKSESCPVSDAENILDSDSDSDDSCRTEIKTQQFAVPQNAERGPIKIVEKFQENKQLKKQAERAMKDDVVRRKVKSVCEKLENGQDPKTIGKKSKYLGMGKGYIRDGRLRMYYEEFHGEIEIIAVAAKDLNIKPVLNLLKDIYDLDINIHD